MRQSIRWEDEDLIFAVNWIGYCKLHHINFKETICEGLPQRKKLGRVPWSKVEVMLRKTIERKFREDRVQMKDLPEKGTRCLIQDRLPARWRERSQNIQQELFPDHHGSSLKDGEIKVSSNPPCFRCQLTKYKDLGHAPISSNNSSMATHVDIDT